MEEERTCPRFARRSGSAGTLASFEEALTSDPARVGALVHAARAHRALGQYDEALSKLYSALEVGGEREKDAYLNLGEAYRLRAEPDSAAKYRALYRGDPRIRRLSSSKETSRRTGTLSPTVR